MMGKKYFKTIITFAILLVLVPSVLAGQKATKTDFDEDLGVITLTVEERSFFDRLFGGFGQEIFVTPGKPKVGEKTKLTFFEEIDFCVHQDAPWLQMDYHLVDPSNKVTLKTATVEACFSSIQFNFEYTPNKQGEWDAAYTIWHACPGSRPTPGTAPGDCPFAVADKRSFSVGDDDKGCPKDECDNFKFLKKSEDGHGQIWKQDCVIYGDAPSCNLKEIPNFVLKCDEGYVVGNTNQQEKDVDSSGARCNKKKDDPPPPGDDDGGDTGETCDDFPQFEDCECVSDVDCPVGDACNILKQCDFIGDDNPPDFGGGGFGDGDGVFDFGDDGSGNGGGGGVPVETFESFQPLCDGVVDGNCNQEDVRNFAVGSIIIVFLVIVLVVVIVRRRKR